MRVTVSIPSTKESGGLRPFTLYNVEVRTDDPKTNSYNKWLISIRFNDFHELFEKLQNKHASLKGYDFPSKQVFGRFDQEVIEMRRSGLEKFLQYCLSLQEVLFDEKFMAFLKITHLRGQIQLSQLSNPETIPDRPKSSANVAPQTTQLAPPAATAGSRVSATVPPQLNALPDIVQSSQDATKRNTVKLPPPPEAGVDMRAMYSYSDGTIAFEEGDLIRVVEKQGSWWGAYVKGTYCEVPANYLEALDAQTAVSSSKPTNADADEGSEYTEGLEAVGMFDYSGSSAQQMITFKSGDIIDLYAPDQEGDWWFGSVRGTTDWGYFPRNYCRVLVADDYVLVDGKWEYREDLTDYTYDSVKKSYVHNSKLAQVSAATAKFAGSLPKRPLPTKPQTLTAAQTQEAAAAASKAAQQQRQSVMLPKVAQRPASIMISKPVNSAPSVPESN